MIKMEKYRVSIKEFIKSIEVKGKFQYYEKIVTFTI